MAETIYFRKKLIGGLDPDDVYEHIQELTREIESAHERISEFEQEMSNSHIRIKGFEEKEKALKETMQMINNYSHKLDQEAQERKNQIVEAAKHEADEIIRRANEKRTVLEQDLLRFKKQKQVVLSDLKGICNRHLALLRAETVEQDSLSLIEEPALEDDVSC